MRRRRRPLLRTAALAGGGAALYHAGKKNAANADHEAEQDAMIQQNAAPAQAMPAAPAQSGGGGLSDDAMARLKELGQLHEQGVLTDDEFTSQKNAILGG
jgi:Short C-terminal domain